jgi:serine/threonine-protein kinase
MNDSDPAYIDRYRIDARVGLRWSEALYTAFDEKMRRPVSIRALFRMGLDDETYAQRVAEQENAAHAVSRLNHPGILQVLDFGTQRAGAYLVMERLPGKTLRARLEDKETFASARAAAITLRLLAVLEHVHNAGILHRNIDADCVVLGDDDSVKLADFDLARLPGTADKPGLMSGKVALMAPEQILGASIDERTDLFQVGLLLYRMLTGRQPFSADSAWALAKQILQQEPLPPSRIDAAIPVAFDDVVANALQKDPAARYPSARAFARALREAAQSA